MKDDELIARLERASRDCSGHEPSLSALQRAADEAAARLKALTAEVERLQKECNHWHSLANKRALEIAVVWPREIRR